MIWFNLKLSSSSSRKKIFAVNNFSENIDDDRHDDGEITLYDKLILHRANAKGNILSNVNLDAR